MGEKAGNGRRKQVVADHAFMEELISDQCQLGFKANRDAGAITEVAVLKVNGSEKSISLYGDLRYSRNPNATELGTKQEIENEWVDAEEIQEVNIAGQIGQLNDFRFEMQSGKCNFPRRGSEKLWETKCRVFGWKVRRV